MPDFRLCEKCGDDAGAGVAVIPAKAGIHTVFPLRHYFRAAERFAFSAGPVWIPAFAGMTKVCAAPLRGLICVCAGSQGVAAVLDNAALLGL